MKAETINVFFNAVYDRPRKGAILSYEWILDNPAFSQLHIMMECHRNEFKVVKPVVSSFDEESNKRATPENHKQVFDEDFKCLKGCSILIPKGTKDTELRLFLQDALLQKLWGEKT